LRGLQQEKSEGHGGGGEVAAPTKEKGFRPTKSDNLQKQMPGKNKTVGKINERTEGSEEKKKSWTWRATPLGGWKEK